MTVDHQTKEDGTVTIRERDTMKQYRVSIGELEAIVADKVGMLQLFEKLV